MNPVFSALAAAEVLGRHAVGHAPELRKKIGRWARRPVKAGPIPLARLEAAIRGLGDIAGRHVLVHSAWDSLSRVEAKPSQIVELLLELIGKEGTLIMPTHPLLTERNGEVVYDVKRSPSAVGLLTECLRRMPGSVRSPSPEAPVSALGKDAAEYGRDFREESKGTSYGRGSPYARVAEREGRSLFLGIAFMRANTLEHVAFDLLDDDNPIANYWVTKSMTVVRNGSAEQWSYRRHRDDLEPYLASYVFGLMAERSGTLRWSNVDGLSIGLLDARRFIDWHLPIARVTGLPYWGFERK